MARAYSGDCMQHLRNIFLDAMSAAASAHLKVALEDSLGEFAFHERMAPDGSALIRAMYALTLLTANPNPNPSPNPHPHPNPNPNPNPNPHPSPTP